MHKQILILLAFLCPVLLSAQSSVPENWFNLDPERDGMNGVSSERMYNELLRGKESKTVVVAVLDSGVDAEHEDLEDVMWINEDEVPGNGIDDDQNGYVDDIHGWNFLGGAEGNVAADNLEITRLYRQYEAMFGQIDDPLSLNEEEKEQYGKYLKYKKEYFKNRNRAKVVLDQIEDRMQQTVDVVKRVEKALDGKKLSLENVKRIEAEDDYALNQAKKMMIRNLEEIEWESFEEIYDAIEEQFTESKRYEYYYTQYNNWYNIDYDPRHIVGDNYADPYGMGYGNNDVEGPEASHGTHVAGIIAAVRGNNAGMKGVADNVRIMSVRTVPDGDERDKDVANAIRYAVDNGARVINMSFGKGFSWDKQVVDEAVRYAELHDVLLVHAAGNDGKDIDDEDNFPNDTYAERKFLAPKSCKTWIEVGALNYRQGENMAAPFSNYGQKQVDLFAPGMAIYSTMPDDEYASLQGTSMASPVVAGVAAVVRSYYPELSARQVRKILLKSVKEVDEEVVRPGSGKRVSFDELCRTGGIVNAYKAIEMAGKKKGKRSKVLRKAKKKERKVRKARQSDRAGKSKKGSA